MWKFSSNEWMFNTLCYVRHAIGTFRIFLLCSVFNNMKFNTLRYVRYALNTLRNFCFVLNSVSAPVWYVILWLRMWQLFDIGNDDSLLKNSLNNFKFLDWFKWKRHRNINTNCLLKTVHLQLHSVWENQFEVRGSEGNRNGK